jgi:hypothetical protein
MVGIISNVAELKELIDARLARKASQSDCEAVFIAQPDCRDCPQLKDHQSSMNLTTSLSRACTSVRRRE